MTNIAVTHADSGVITAEVVRSIQISPSIRRVTIGGGELGSFDYLGYDQWFRLLVPTGDKVRFDNVPTTVDATGYLRYLTLPKRTRPVMRSYTVRQFRPDDLELDVDFVVHGDSGVAGPWAMSAEPGAPIGFIDQGHGFRPEMAAMADELLIAGDETAMPAVLGVLRSLPSDARGVAFVELPDAGDEQPVETRSQVKVQWLVRGRDQPPGQATLAAVRKHQTSSSVYAFAVGESKLATGVRKLLVGEREVDKNQVTFCGYYKLPKRH